MSFVDWHRIMLSMNNLKPGVLIELEGEPYQVLEAHHNKVAQRRPVMQTKIRHLISGKVRAETFQQSDKVDEADIERLKAKFAYRTRDEFFFQTDGGEKFGLAQDLLQEKTGYLKKDLPCEVLIFNGQPISLELPIKVVLRVKDAPPGLKGDTVQGGLKDVLLETGITVKTPLFVEAGDFIEVDTRTSEYTRRATEE
ncbi:MAG: elongation factor P [Parcubacteria group bacterium]|nr:elongation factor P [Parcubacteria group bacterium]